MLTEILCAANFLVYHVIWYIVDWLVAVARDCSQVGHGTVHCNEGVLCC